jgi:hypothetical protein
MSPKTRTAALAATAGAFTLALCVRITVPFDRHQEWVSIVFASFARNHNDLGYGTTRLGLVHLTPGQREAFSDPREFLYPNRPFLPALAISVLFRVAGPSDAVFRLGMIAVAVGSLLLFAALARRLLPRPWDLAATAAFAFNPMFAWFSLLAVHLAYALFFLLAAWLFALRHEVSGRRRDAAAMIAAAFLACLCDWPGHVGSGALGLWQLLRGRKAIAAGLVATAVGAFGLHLLHLLWLDPSGRVVARFFSAPGERMALQGGVVGFAVGEAREVLLYFTVGLVAAAGVGIRVLWRERRDPRASAVLVLALLGLDELVFLQWAHVHDFLTFTLAPFVALAAAKGFGALRRRPAAVALAALQAAWVLGDRLTKRGGYEVSVEAGRAIRERTVPGERILIACDSRPMVASYYSERHTAGIEVYRGSLHVHDAAARTPVPTTEALERYLEEHGGDYDWIVTADPGRVTALEFFRRSQGLLPRFWIFPEEHPLRRLLARKAVLRADHGAFVFYRMR